MKQFYIETPKRAGMDLISKLYADSLECNVKLAWKHESDDKLLIVVDNDILSDNIDWFLKKIRRYKKIEEYKGMAVTSPIPYNGLEPDWKWCSIAITMYNASKFVGNLKEISEHMEHLKKLDDF